MNESALSFDRILCLFATPPIEAQEEWVNILPILQILGICGLGAAMGCCLFCQGSYLWVQGSYLWAQAAAIPSTTIMAPDALGTTVLTVGGGGLVVALAAISKDFWSYKKQQIESEERREKEERESRERIETARIAIEKMRYSQSKNNRLTNAMLQWMVTAYNSKTFPPPPPRVDLSEEPKLGK